MSVCVYTSWLTTNQSHLFVANVNTPVNVSTETKGGKSNLKEKKRIHSEKKT